MTQNLINHPHIEMIAPASLRPSSTHARKHTPKQVDQIARSIDRYGFIVPLIIDDENTIVAGMGRWEAARLRKLESVPIIRVHFLSKADARAFALADNRLAELSSWDDIKLGEELNFLFEQNYDLSLTGFDLSDLDLSLDTAAQPTEAPIKLPDPTSQPVSRLGDRWSIGPHRLYCGDARNPSSYEALLGGELAAMVFSDPPYNVPIDGHVSGLGKVQHREFAMASGEMSPADFTAMLRDVFRSCVRFGHDGSIHYHCMDWRHMREMLDASAGVYADLKQLVVWNKQVGGMGTFYRSQHELVFVFKSGKAKHINNFGLGDTGRYRTNVWDYAGANGFRKGRDIDLHDHPTIKSLPMVMDAILDCSNRDDPILDPFSGSGTSLVAAHRTKRRGAAIEIDPLYVDTSLRRLMAATGLQATLDDGMTFDDVKALRTGQTETVHG